MKNRIIFDKNGVSVIKIYPNREVPNTDKDWVQYTLKKMAMEAARDAEWKGVAS